MDQETIKRIEAKVDSILKLAEAQCSARQYGLTNFRYKDIGEVFSVDGGPGYDCYVHVLPGFEESIMLVRGPSLIALTRSHAEPINENMLWKMTLRRDPQDKVIPHMKNMVISDLTISKLPVILQKRPSNRIQISATELMEAYTSFRGTWKKNRETVVAAQKMAQDMEGFMPTNPTPDNDFKQTRERITDVDIGTIEI